MTLKKDTLKANTNSRKTKNESVKQTDNQPVLGVVGNTIWILTNEEPTEREQTLTIDGFEKPFPIEWVDDRNAFLIELLMGYNLIENGGFTEGDKKSLKGWEVESVEGALAGVDLDDEWQLTGGHTAFLLAAENAPRPSITVIQKIPMMTEVEYKFSGYFATQRAEGLIRLFCYDENDCVIDEKIIHIANQTEYSGGTSLNNYALSELIFTPISGTKYLKFKIELSEQIALTLPNGYLFFTGLFLGVANKEFNSDCFKDYSPDVHVLTYRIIFDSYKYFGKINVTELSGMVFTVDLWNKKNTFDLLYVKRSGIIRLQQNILVEYDIKIDSQSICGWIVDAKNIEIPLQLKIYIDNELIAQLTANHFGKKILSENVGIESGKCAFGTLIPNKFFDNFIHEISIKESNSDKLIWRGKIFLKEKLNIKNIESIKFHNVSNPRVLIIDTEKRTRNSYISLAILESFKVHNRIEFVTLANYSNAIYEFKKNKCNTLIALGGSGGDIAIINKLCSLAFYSALWTTEDPYEEKENFRLSNMFTRVFTNEESSASRYGEKGRYLPLAASKKLHFFPVLENNEDYRYDLLFIGTGWPNRVRTLNKIIKELGDDLNVKIGLSYNEHLVKKELDNSGLISNWRVSNTNFSKLCNRSRIVLCLNRTFSSSDNINYSCGISPPPRLFEVAAAGGFQLTLSDKVGLMDDLDISVIGKEEYLTEKIKYYLEHSEERIKIAKLSQLSVMKKNSYDNRSEVLIEDILSMKIQQSTATNKFKRILFVTHNVIGRQPYGGVEIYQNQLTEFDGFEVLFLWPSCKNTLTLHFQNGDECSYDIPPLTSQNVLSDGFWEQCFKRILIEQEIEIVHFQHLIGWPLSMPLVAKVLGIKTVYTFHDYYLICSKFTLLSFSGSHCETNYHPIESCDICLKATDNFVAGSQQKRRNFIRSIVESLDTIIFNTQYSKQYFESIYLGTSSEKLICIEMMLPNYEKYIDKPLGISNKKIAIGIPGNFTSHKGADIIIRIMNEIRETDIEFVIFGTLEPKYQAICSALDFKNLTIVGGYEQEELPELLSKIDITLHLSIWPETYVISLSEAWAAGAVPIVSDIGALSERVTHDVDGFVVPVNDGGSVVKLINFVFENREVLSRIKSNIVNKKIVNKEEHITKLTNLYQKLTIINKRNKVSNFSMLDSDFVFSIEQAGIRVNNPRWDVNDIIEDQSLDDCKVQNNVSSTTKWIDYFPANLEFKTKKYHLEEFKVEHIKINDVPKKNLSKLTIDLTSSGEKKFFIEGWALDTAFPKKIVESYICLESYNLVRIAPLTKSIRPDIRKYSNIKNEIECGFLGEYNLDGLPSGTYNVVIMQICKSVIDYFPLKVTLEL